jgi:hypothetical protein
MRLYAILSLALVLILADGARADALPLGGLRTPRIQAPPRNAVALRVQTGTGRGRLIVPRNSLRRAKQWATLPTTSAVLLAGVPLVGLGLLRRNRAALGALALLLVLGPGLLLVQANPVIPGVSRPVPRLPTPKPEEKPPLLQVEKMTLEVVEEGDYIVIVLPTASVEKLAK